MSEEKKIVVLPSEVLSTPTGMASTAVLADPDNLNKVLGLIESGMTVSQAAKEFGIGRDGLYTWRRRNPEFIPVFEEALRRGRRNRAEALLHKTDAHLANQLDNGWATKMCPVFDEHNNPVWELDEDLEPVLDEEGHPVQKMAPQVVSTLTPKDTVAIGKHTTDRLGDTSSGTNIQQNFDNRRQTINHAATAPDPERIVAEMMGATSDE